MSEYKIRIQILKQKSTLVIFKNSSEQELNSCRVAWIPGGMYSTIELSSQLPVGFLLLIYFSYE